MPRRHKGRFLAVQTEIRRRPFDETFERHGDERFPKPLDESRFIGVQRKRHTDFDGKKRLIQ